MTATERLRELLDERGVEHYDGTESTLWGYEDYNEFTGIYRFSADETSDGYMQMRLWHVTPEQAIAAALGDVPRLPYFWTHDGTLHVELPKLPESISVRLPGQRDREVGSARVWQYTRDNETCKDVCNSVSEFTCSACGFNCDLMSWISLFDGDDGRHRHHHHGTPNYCPNCGRKVVDE